MRSCREGLSCGVHPPLRYTNLLRGQFLTALLTFSYSSVFTSSFASSWKSSLCLSSRLHICLRCFSCLLHALIALFVFPSDKQLPLYNELCAYVQLLLLSSCSLEDRSFILLSPAPGTVRCTSGLGHFEECKYLLINRWGHIFLSFCRGWEWVGILISTLPGELTAYRKYTCLINTCHPLVPTWLSLGQGNVSTLWFLHTFLLPISSHFSHLTFFSIFPDRRR